MNSSNIYFQVQDFQYGGHCYNFHVDYCEKDDHIGVSKLYYWSEQIDDWCSMGLTEKFEKIIRNNIEILVDEYHYVV